LVLAASFLLVSAALAADFTPLSDLPGGIFSSQALGVSDDGSVVVGWGTSGTDQQEAFRWTFGGGMVGLGDLAGGDFFSRASAVSANGSAIVGWSRSASGLEAFRWTSGGDMVGLGDLPGGVFMSQAFGVSANGSVVAGEGMSASGSEAFRWTSGGISGIGDLAGAPPFSQALGVSANGGVMVGVSISVSGLEAFRWTSDGGMVGLGDIAGGSFSSTANAVSADGNVVVGEGRSASGLEAFRWTSGGGMVGLGDLPGGNFSSSALGVSGDGSVVVGEGNSEIGDEAIVWTAGSGMRRLADVLIERGVTGLSGWTLRSAQHITADGKIVVGYGINPSGQQEAFLANIFSPTFSDVPADYWAHSFIEALADSGITAGCGNDNYCPLSPVTRAQMAVFLERGIHGSDFSPPAAKGNVFLDVPAGDFAASFIEQFFLDGITSGCGNNNYCPDAEVTRDQMAVFLLRAKHGAGYSPPPATGFFLDVPLNHWAVNWIEQLEAEGITGGCGNGKYCPDATVTRDQMAVFLVRTFF